MSRVLVLAPAFHGYGRAIAHALGRAGTAPPCTRTTPTRASPQSGPPARAPPIRSRSTRAGSPPRPSPPCPSTTRTSSSWSRATSSVRTCGRPSTNAACRGSCGSTTRCAVLGGPREDWRRGADRQLLAAGRCRPDGAGLSARFLPLAYDTDLDQAARPVVRRDEVTFVGARYPGREQTLLASARAGVPVRAYGRDWSGTPSTGCAPGELRRPAVPSERDVDRRRGVRRDGRRRGHPQPARRPGRLHDAHLRGLRRRARVQLIDRPDVGGLYDDGSRARRPGRRSTELVELRQRARVDRAWADGLRAAGRARTLAEHTFDHRVARPGGAVGSEPPARPGGLAALAGRPPEPLRRLLGATAALGSRLVGVLTCPSAPRAAGAWSWHPGSRRPACWRSARPPRTSPPTCAVARRPSAAARRPRPGAAGPRGADVVPDRPRVGARSSVSAGHYLPLGAVGARVVTPARGRVPPVQHGLLDPVRAPAGRRTSRLLAWSDGRRRVLAVRARRRRAPRWSARSCSGRPRGPHRHRDRRAPDLPRPAAQRRDAARAMARFTGPFCRARARCATGRTPPSATACPGGSTRRWRASGHRARRRHGAAARAAARRSSASSRPASSRPPPAACRPGSAYDRPAALARGVLGALRHAPLRRRARRPHPHGPSVEPAPRSPPRS